MAVITTFKDVVYITGGDFTPEEAERIIPAFFPNAKALIINVCDYDGCDGITRILCMREVYQIPTLHEQGYFFEIREAKGK